MPVLRERSSQRGDSGVSSAMHEIQIDLERKYSVKTHVIPLGGTIAMVKDLQSRLISEAHGCFDSSQYHTFNNEVATYAPGYLNRLEPPFSNPASFSDTLLYKTDREFPPLANIDDSHIFATRSVDLWNSGAWPSMVEQFPLPTGQYKRAILATDPQASIQYAYDLSERLKQDEFNQGARLDSAELYDAGPTFAAVFCSYIIPEVRQHIAGIAKELHISQTESLGKTVFFIPVGTDRQTEIANFLDIFSYYTGATFITLGANSSFGVENGDAEKNIKDAGIVAEMIVKGVLPRGATYTVADHTVMQNIIGKMDPSARGLKQTQLLQDGYVYGGTFLAHNTRGIDELESNPWPVRQTDPKDPNMLFKIPSRPIDAALFTKAMYAGYTVDANIMPAELPLGTRALIVKGAGEGNSPEYTVDAIQYAVGQQWARSGNSIRSPIVVTSDAGIPYVGVDYSASLLGKLEKHRWLYNYMVNGHKLPPKVISQLATFQVWPWVQEDWWMCHNKDFVGSYYLKADELQTLVDEYSEARNLI